MNYLVLLCLLVVSGIASATPVTGATDSAERPAAAAPAVAERWKISGGEVLDTRTGLTWKRCSVGMNWDGKTACSGEKRLLDQDGLSNLHEGPWRVPTQEELSTLVDESRKEAGAAPVIDTTVFPDMNDGQFWYWTRSINSHNDAMGIVVVFTTGFINRNVYISNAFPVRLVRGSK